MPETPTIAELQALYEKTTPGEWKAVMCDDGPMLCTDGDILAIQHGNHEPDDRTDGVNFRFIAAIHNAFPTLIAQIKAEAFVACAPDTLAAIAQARAEGRAEGIREAANALRKEHERAHIDGFGDILHAIRSLAARPAEEKGK